MHAKTSNRDDRHEILPGFGHITRIWDSKENCYASKILPGEYYVTCQDEIITTVLGSCVSACVRDPAAGVGGMNHFMLPGDRTKRLDQWAGQDSLATRYGIAAMEMLVNDLLKQGARKDRLELKLFGGGKVLAMDINDVGNRNIQFVREFIKTEGLVAVAEDLGGTHPRKVNFFPKTGKVMVRRLRALQNRAIADREKKYAVTLSRKEVPGDIELFT